MTKEPKKINQKLFEKQTENLELKLKNQCNKNTHEIACQTQDCPINQINSQNHTQISRKQKYYDEKLEILKQEFFQIHEDILQNISPEVGKAKKEQIV
jgi:hypothetical protein